LASTTRHRHSLNGLALVLRDKDDLDHARTMHECALAIREARLALTTPIPCEAERILRRWWRRWRIASSRLTLYDVDVWF
jgi:hypothetical protein